MARQNKPMDLPWTFVPNLETEAQLRAQVFHKEPTLIYIYNPMCPYCVRGQPVFEAAVKNGPRRVFRFNAVPSEALSESRHKLFEKVTGVTITHYPMILGISADGRLVEYKGNVSRQALHNFYEALRST